MMLVGSGRVQMLRVFKINNTLTHTKPAAAYTSEAEEPKKQVIVH
jgi:hypothetical protein